MEELEFLDSQKLQAHSMTSKSADLDAATQPPPRKRTKAHSCNSCRRRKLKCDRGWPCGACRDRNEAHLCTWQEGVVPERVGRDAPDNMMLIQRMASLESKFDALLDKIDRMGDSKSGKELSIVQSETHNLEEMQSNSISDASFMLSMFLQPTDLAQRRRVLSRMLHNTPNIKLLASILDSFNGQMHCINCIVDKKCVEAHLNDVVLLQNEVMHKKDFVDKLNKDELTRYIYSVSSCLAICSLSLVISRDTKLDILRNDKDSLPLFQRYIRESLIGLSSLHPRVLFGLFPVARHGQLFDWTRGSSGIFTRHGCRAASRHAIRRGFEECAAILRPLYARLVRDHDNQAVPADSL